MSHDNTGHASDTYSVGMIMWVIALFPDREYDLELILKTIKGLRLKINTDTPQCYVDLMEEHWNKDPSERSSTETVYDISMAWVNDLLNGKKSRRFNYVFKCTSHITTKILY
ncbi:hypothetical protein Glove_91g12 [Diversispora epigaea]|uniref:Serine-threonine/tyrosine-protein kinase catalytic domain-containing protein n=1 Tax=Diversispora epigaea TaxID=1348612 RepID=A0A397J5J4_9GLOM|nr:hypothetical protein Glove_91g12 [Diversispora epigaea]